MKKILLLLFLPLLARAETLVVCTVHNTSDQLVHVVAFQPSYDDIADETLLEPGPDSEPWNWQNPVDPDAGPIELRFYVADALVTTATVDEVNDWTVVFDGASATAASAPPVSENEVNAGNVVQWTLAGFGFQLLIEGTSLCFLAIRHAKQAGRGWLSS